MGNTNSELSTFKKKFKEKFKNFLSTRQINSIGTKTEITRYETNEILSAMHIRYCSTRAYKIFRTFLPVPSVSTLKNWARKIE